MFEEKRSGTCYGKKRGVALIGRDESRALVSERREAVSIVAEEGTDPKKVNVIDCLVDLFD